MVDWYTCWCHENPGVVVAWDWPAIDTLGTGCWRILTPHDRIGSDTIMTITFGLLPHSVDGSAVLEDSLYKISANLERQLCELYNLAHIHLGKPTCESPPSPAYSKRTCLHVVNTQPPTRLLLVVTRRMPISTILRKCESIWRNVSKTMPCFLSLLGLYKCAKSTSTRWLY